MSVGRTMNVCVVYGVCVFVCVCVCVSQEVWGGHGDACTDTCLLLLLTHLHYLHCQTEVLTL